MKLASLKLEKKASQSIISEGKTISHHNFYRYNCCKNNKFELLLQSLFAIINLEDRMVESHKSKVKSQNGINPNFRAMIEDNRPMTLDIRHKK